MRRRKSLRIGVHNANAVVWGPVYRTHLRSPRSRRDFVLGGGASTRGRGSLGRGRVLRLRGGERERQGDHDAVLVVVQARFLRRDDAGAGGRKGSDGVRFGGSVVVFEGSRPPENIIRKIRRASRRPETHLEGLVPHDVPAVLRRGLLHLHRGLDRDHGGRHRVAARAGDARARSATSGVLTAKISVTDDAIRSARVSGFVTLASHVFRRSLCYRSTTPPRAATRRPAVARASPARSSASRGCPRRRRARTRCSPCRRPGTPQRAPSVAGPPRLPE